MTVRKVEVRNYQSLRSADLALGRFTVITGPTGSGKSALFRALLMLACNARGTSYISAGTAECSVTAGGEGWIVRLTRSSSPRGANEYRTAEAREADWACDRFTKLGGQVPEPVADLLQLSPLNFARQFDSPFLLDVSGTAMARKLGELTNVTLVLNAASRANQLRKQLARDLDAARARRDALKEEARAFAGLRDRRRAATTAEEALERAQAAAARLNRLRAAGARLEAAEAAKAAAEAEAARQAPPPLDRLAGLASRYTRLAELTRALNSAGREHAGAVLAAGAAHAAEKLAAQAVHDALAAAGQCPTCGQAVA